MSCTPEWSPGSTHYTHFLGPILKAMSVDDLVKEALRNPFEAELNRRQEDAAQRVEYAQAGQTRIAQQIKEARERFKHL